MVRPTNSRTIVQSPLYDSDLDDTASDVESMGSPPATPRRASSQGDRIQTQTQTQTRFGNNTVGSHEALHATAVEAAANTSAVLIKIAPQSMQSPKQTSTSDHKNTQAIRYAPVTTWKSLVDFTAGLTRTQLTVPASELKSNITGIKAPASTIVSIFKDQAAEPNEVKLHMNTVRYSDEVKEGYAVENRIGQTAGAAHSIQNSLLAALSQEGDSHSIYSFYNPLRDFPSRGDFAQVFELAKRSEGSNIPLNIEGFELMGCAEISTNQHAARSIKLWFKVPGSDTDIKSIVLTEFTKPASFTQALSVEELQSYRTTVKSMGREDKLTFVSKAGIGRSAALSVYNQLAKSIESGAIKTPDELKAAFYAHLAQGRRDRGVRFLDVTVQQESIMAALAIDLIEALKSEPNAKPTEE